MPKTLRNGNSSVPTIVDINTGELSYVVKVEEAAVEVKYVTTGEGIKDENDASDEEIPEFVLDISDLQNSIPADVDEEDDGVVEEYLDECFDLDDNNDGGDFEPNQGSILDHQYGSKVEDPPSPPHFFTIQELPETKSNRKSRRVPHANRKTQQHKLRQLTGRPSCKYCDKIFNSKESRDAHDCPYLHCDPDKYICRICHKELSRKTFSNHLHETLSCQYCSKSFVNPRNLKNHIKNSHANADYIPPRPLDPELFQNLGEQDELGDEPTLDESTGQWFFPSLAIMPKVVKPRKRYQPVRGSFECDKCGRILTTLRSLRSHVDIHMGILKYVCSVCGEKYATSSGLSKHACLNKKRKRPDVDFRTYDVRHCKFCGESFPSLEANRAHSCEFQFTDEPKSFKCRFCYAVMAKNSYNKHMLRHLATNEELMCNVCGKVLSDTTTLALHHTTHTGNKPFKCEFHECGQSFINKALLQRHMRFHGVEIERFHCPICRKEVATKYHLKHHMKIHSSRVECQICKEDFETREELREHYQANHEAFKCQYCSKTFTLLRYLRMHEQTHEEREEKAFKCDFCPRKTFSKLALLMNHMLKAHEEAMEEWKKSYF